MDLIKIEPNTDGDIQPTFILAEVQDEQNCFTVMKTESLVSVFLILLLLPHGTRRKYLVIVLTEDMTFVIVEKGSLCHFFVIVEQIHIFSSLMNEYKFLYSYILHSLPLKCLTFFHMLIYI